MTIGEAPYLSPRHLLGLVITLIGIFGLATAVAAQSEEPDLLIVLQTVVRAPAGSETVLRSVPTPDDLIGGSCAVAARSENRSSVHPDNDLIIRSATTVTLQDVEAEPGSIVTANDTITLSDQIVIVLSMGTDEVFSAGIDLRFVCEPAPTTTTTLGTTTTTDDAPTTTAEPSTTTTDDVAGTTVTTQPPNTSTTQGVSPTSDVTSTTIEDEVLGTEVLPFTGPERGGLGLVALALVALGLVCVIGTRSFEES